MLKREDLTLLHQARLKFLEKFEAKHPGYCKGRAIWK
jgi:hypothetical protein